MKKMSLRKIEANGKYHYIYSADGYVNKQSGRYYGVEVALEFIFNKKTGKQIKLIVMKCKYCGGAITPFSFLKHYFTCKQERKKLIDIKINRVLTVPDVSLQNLIKDNIKDLNTALSHDKSYSNVYNSKLYLEEAIAVNNLFWYAKTPYYGSFSYGWLSLHKFFVENGSIYAVCSDWRSGPPDTAILPIDLIPAEILAEALVLIDISIDIELFKEGSSYQQYIYKYVSNHD